MIYSLRDLTTLIRRGVIPHYTDEEGLPILNQRCIRLHALHLGLARHHCIKSRAVSESQLLQKYDILINSTGIGTLGRSAQCRSSFYATVDSHVTIVRPNPAVVDPLYLGFVLRYLQPLLEQMGRGSTGQIELPIEYLADLSIPLPSREKQQQVAQFLVHFDDKIACNQQMSLALEKIVTLLFKKWFFSQESARWPVVSLGQLVTHSIGGDWGEKAQDALHTERVVVIRGCDIPLIKNQSFYALPVRYIKSTKLPPRALQKGDIIVETSGGGKNQPTGRVLYISQALLDMFDAPVIPASFCRLLRPEQSPYGLFLSQYLDYIYQLGKTGLYQNQSAGIYNLHLTRLLEKERVNVPPSSMLESYSALVEPLLLQSFSKENALLYRLRELLLSYLMSPKCPIKQQRSC